MTVMRMWRGRVPASRADDYVRYLQETGVKDYRAAEGNRGVQVLRRMRAGEAEFLTVTWWDSLDAVRNFAGDDIERAVYYPEDQEYLLQFEPTVAHYEVVVDS